MSTIPLYIPKPFRDISKDNATIKNFIYSFKDKSINKDLRAVAALIGAGENLREPAERMIKTACHAGLAALGVFAACKIGIPLAAGTIVASLLSLPAAIVAGGSWMLYHGVAAAISGLFSGSLSTLGTGITSSVIGWAMLESYDVKEFQIGFLENTLVKSTVDNLTQPLVEVYCNDR